MRYILRLDVACPLQVEHVTLPFKHLKSSSFATIYKGVVNVAIVCNSEGHKQSFDLFSLVASNPITLTFDLHVAWIRKEYCGRSILENRLQKANFRYMRLEYTVR